MNVPEIMRGKHHPRDPMTEPRPRTTPPDGSPPAPNAGTADPSRHPAASENVRSS